MQETFLLQARIAGAARKATELGFFSSFIPARGAAGRSSGGLAILYKQAAPLQEMEECPHWEAGRWAHYLLPFEGGLHIYNAPKKNREMLLEILVETGTLNLRSSPLTWCMALQCNDQSVTRKPLGFPLYALNCALLCSLSPG
eukprot:3301222-Amphidinium_carterae.1